MSNWISICESTAIAPNTGVCAKVDDKQIAVFFSQRTNSLHAISNFDPIGKANILSRGFLVVWERYCVLPRLYTNNIFVWKQANASKTQSITCRFMKSEITTA